MKTLKELDRIFLYDFFCRDGKLYYAAYNLSGIFSFDINKKENELLSYIPAEVVPNGGGYYSGIFIRNDDVVVVPDHASSLVIYNLKTNKLTKVQLPNTKVDCPTFSKFQSIINVGDRIFCIPIRYPGLVEIEKNGNTILYQNFLLDQKELLVGDACIWNHQIYMTIYNTSDLEDRRLLLFRIKTSEFESIETKYKSIYHLCAADQGIWMVTEKGLVFWNIEKKISQTYPFPNEIEGKKSLIKIVYFDNKIGMFANDGVFYTFFVIEKSEYEKITYLSDRVCHRHIVNNYISIKVYDSKLFYFNASVGKLFIFSDDQRSEYQLNIPSQYKENYLENLDLHGKIINEDMELNIWGHFMQVNDYISCIDLDKRENSKNKKNMIGRKIFERIKKI